MNPSSLNYHAFTQKYPGITNRIITPVYVCDAFDPANPPENPKFITTNALWDTGATQSVITETTAKILGLAPTGKKLVHHAGGKGDYNAYVVNFLLPNQVGVSGVLVSECPDVAGAFGAIIGMDIIMRGDLAISNHRGQSWVTFRIPSMSAVDYVAEHNQPAISGKVGRNSPCPCGSGKKYKYCHGA